MTVRAISFDLFDTLVDLRWESLPAHEQGGRRLPASAPPLHACLRRRVDVSWDAFLDALLAGGRAFAESHFAAGREVSTLLRFTDLLTRLGVEDEALAGELTEVHMGVLHGGVRVLPHHRDVLDELRPGVSLGLCSNFSHTPTALRVLDDAGLRERLEPGALVVSEDFGLRKPRKEIFEAVLERLGVAAADALHVGDSLRADVGGAAPLGVRTVWVTRRVPDVADALAKHDGPRPDFTIADLSELPALVASLA